MMETFGNIYSSVENFWDAPILVVSFIIALMYIGLGIRTTARTYVETGKLILAGDNSSLLGTIRNPYAMEVFMFSFLIMAVPSMALVFWPITAPLLIIICLTILSVRRQRARVAFKQALRGEVSEEKSRGYSR